MPQDNKNTSKSVWPKLKDMFLGLLLLSGLVILVTHLGELEHFAQLVRQAEPVWLIMAVLLQAMTYISLAGVWYLALRFAGVRYSFTPLIPLGIAKFFSDQTVPSGGIGGTAFFFAALNRRGIPSHLCMATLLLSLMAYYLAYLLAAFITVLILYFYHDLQIWILIVVIIFSIYAVGVPAGALWLKDLKDKELPNFMLRIPGLNGIKDTIANAPHELLRNHLLILCAVALHALIFMLDTATLWVMLQVVGAHISIWAVFPSFVLASMVATVGPVPLGLGTFEVTCVNMLKVMGVSIEAAFTATLLLRGFTLWLPMLPGMWLTRRALK